MDYGDKSWMNLLRWADEYIRGVNNFLNVGWRWGLFSVLGYLGKDYKNI